MNWDEAASLYRATQENPVASYELRKKYDPEGRLGFCFGRALAVHLEALRVGIRRESIRKIWAVGKLQLGDLKWQHHVATMVRANDGGWWVIDPMWEAPMKATQWMTRMRWVFATWKDPEIQFMVTKPERFGTEFSDKYSKEELTSDWYGDFFKDLFKYYRERPRRAPRPHRDLR